MKSKIFLFILIFVSYSLFSQANDDIYFDGVEEIKVEKKVSSEQYDSEEINIYVESDLNYTSRINNNTINTRSYNNNSVRR